MNTDTSAAARQRVGVQIELGQLAETVENVKKVIAFRSARDGDTSPGAVEALCGLARAQIALGDFLSTEATCRKVIATFANGGRAKPIDLALAQRNLAVTLIGQQRFNEAEALLLSVYNALEIEPSMYLHNLMDMELQLADLYEKMHTAQPTHGFDAKAGEWREQLNSRRGTTQPAGR